MNFYSISGDEIHDRRHFRCFLVKASVLAEGETGVCKLRRSMRNCLRGRSHGQMALTFMNEASEWFSLNGKFIPWKFSGVSRNFLSPHVAVEFPRNSARVLSISPPNLRASKTFFYLIRLSTYHAIIELCPTTKISKNLCLPKPNKLNLHAKIFEFLSRLNMQMIRVIEIAR